MENNLQKRNNKNTRNNKIQTNQTSNIKKRFQH